MTSNHDHTYKKPKSPENKTWWIVLIAVIAIAIALWNFIDTDKHLDSSFSTHRAEQMRFAMGTAIRIVAEGEKADEAVDAAIDEMIRLSDLFDRFDESSDISRLNANGSEWTSLSADTIELLDQAIIMATVTEGAFDPTVTPLIDLWGFVEENPNLYPTGGETDLAERTFPGSDETIGQSPTAMRGFMPPPPEAIEELLPLVNFRGIELDKRMGRARILILGQQIDLGGIAKGYAADRAARILQDFNVERALIDLGGDIRTIGYRDTENEPWRLGLRHPREDGIIAIVYLSDLSIATSGDYERFFEYDGVRYNHIVNPRTGIPADQLISVSVVAPTAVEADAFATAIFVLGVENGVALLDQFPDIEGVLIDQEGHVHITDGLLHKVVLE